MRWWDFSDSNFLLFFVITLITIFLTLSFLVSLYILYLSKKRYKQKIKQESNTVRIFNINVKNNEVVYFNKNDIRNKRKVNLGQFYDFFHPNDADKVKGWVFAISFNNSNVEDYLEVDVRVDRGRRKYFSLLKLIKYDPKIGVIHLESVILRYITPINTAARRKGGMFVGVVKRSQMASIINKKQSLTGYTFAIRFFYIKQQVLTNGKVEHFMSVTLKNEIFPFAVDGKNTRQILNVSENEIILFDLKMVTREAAVTLGNSISHSLKKAISVNGFFDSISFSVGIVEDSQFFQDFDTIVSKAEEACIIAQQDNVNVFFYQRSNVVHNDVTYYGKEIDKLIEPNTLRYLFRPIVNTELQKIIGYFEYVRAYDSPFADYREMSKYAAMCEKNRNLFACIINHVVPKFANEVLDKEYRLFLNVSMTDLDYLNEIIKQTPLSKTIKIVLVFDEQEVNENGGDVELLNNALIGLKDSGFELGFLLKDKNLLLDPSIYINFDYFITGSAMIGEIKRNNRIRLSIHTLIEQLLKYKKPIIASDLESWQSIELIIKSGVTILSSETISPSNDMFLPLDKKKVEKLAQFWEKYK